MRKQIQNILQVVTTLILLFGTLQQVSSQIEINMCPVSKVPADKQFNIDEITITNNTDVVINTRLNKFKFEWPGLVRFAADLGGTFTGDTWEGKIQVNNWPNEITIGNTSLPKSFNGSNYEGALQIPQGGTFTQGGIEYEVIITNCAQTDAYELYDPQTEFSEECFQRSPTDDLCLGEAATEIWKGTGVRDVMVPEDKKSYAIGIMVAHRLFSNLIGNDTLASPHFWWATGLNETGMICEGMNFTARRKNHCYVNSSDFSCEADGIGVNKSNSSASNCFQILSYGGFLAANQPDLFAQTNRFGTAGAANVVGGGNFETGLIGVVYYQYQSIIYWDQFAGVDAIKVAKEAKDPYFLEKIMYHGFHDGHGAATTVMQQVYDRYDDCIAATDMTPLVSGPTWSSARMGSPKVANFTAVLDGNGNPYPTEKGDATVEYYGCYSEDVPWVDVLHYFDEMKILYPQLMDSDVQDEIKEVYDGINGGSDVNFKKFGPIIDQIVINMGAHNPADFMASQFGGSTSYDSPPLGVALRTFDTICPGEEGTLQLWLAGTPPFKADLKFPDGTIQSHTGITGSPYYITVDQPGEYNVVYFEDKNQVGNIDCNFGGKVVQSKNSAIIGWDKSNLNVADQCIEGDLVINKTGEYDVTISYTLDGSSQPDIIMGADETYQKIASNVDGGTYLITNMSPNECGSPINDEIIMCEIVEEPCNPPLAPSTTDIEICEGNELKLLVNASDATVTYTWSAKTATNSFSGIGDNLVVASTSSKTSDQGTYEVTATKEGCVSEATTVNVVVNTIPSLVVSDPVAQCGGSINLISSTAVIQTITPTDALVSVYSDPTATTAVADSVTSSGNYYLQATNGTCKSSAALVKVEINTTPSLPSASDVELCEGDELKLAVSSPETALTYIWSAKTATNSFSGSGDLAVVASASTKTTDEGTYEVTASENGCTSDPKTVTVSIDGKPNDAAVSSTSLDVCSVDPIALNADAATNNGIGAWTSTGTGAITSTNNPTSAVTGMSGGDQLVATWTVASENGYCASTDATVTINAVLATDPTVSLAQDKTEACEGDVIVFEAKPTTGGTAPLYTFYDFTGNVRGAVLQAESPLATYTTNAATTNLEIEVELKSNSSCIASSSIATAAAIVQVDETPSNATIIEGATLSTCVETESLTSEPIASGLASWSVTNGPGSTANETATGTDVTGLVPSQSTEITFTVASENGYCNANTDVISIDRLGEITKATVSSQSGSLCEDAPFSTLTGNTLQALESASWAALTTGATIDASTGIISSWVEGENQFEYTIANTGSCTDADIVTITIDKVPTTASLSSAATIVTCTDPVNLNANPLTDGSGLWTIVSGNGNLVSGQETSPTAQVENLDETTDLVLAWTTSNGACSNHSTTEVTVDKAGELTSAEITVDGNLILEGETAIVCKDNFTLASSVPSTSGGNTESGTWAIGDASVVAFSPGSSNSPLPTVSSSDKGTTTLSWEISTSLAGCLPSKRTIELEVVDVPVTGTLSKSTLDALCETQEETFTTVAATSATSYEWAIDGTVAGETSSVFVNSFDTYGTTTVSVVAKNSCGADLTPESIDVIVNAVPQLATSSYSACENGTDVELTPLVNITPVLVQDASLTFTNEDGIELSGSTVNESGNYFVTASKDGCTSSSSMIVVEIKPIPSQATLTSTSACVGGDFKVQISNASPLQTYTWTTPQGVASGEELEITNAQLSDEGDYSVVVEQAGCLSITPGVENIELKKTPAPELLLEGGIVSDAIAPVIVCVEDLPKDLQVGNLFESETTEWDYEGQTIDKGQIFESGLYTLTADNGTCTGTAAVEIEVRVLEAIISREPSAVDQGSEVTFRGTVEPYNPDYTYEYTWKGNIHNTIGKGPVLDFVPNETDDYWVTVDELETGCQAESEEKNVIVYLPVTIPAAFTPNGDGANEKWVIIGLETYEKASIKVFNRWGHIVYKSTGNNYEGWDGLNLSGKDVTTGTYYYIIRLNDVLGRVYQGDVTVIR